MKQLFGSRVAILRAPIPTDIFALYLITFAVQLGMGIVSPVLPDIMHDFSLSAWQAGMVMTAFGLARLLTDLPVGLHIERVNRTWILALGGLLVAAGSVLAGLAPDLLTLVVARLIQGIGSACCTVTALFSLSRATGAESRGRVIGFYQAAVLAGATFGPVAGGVAAGVGGWRASFFVSAVAGIVALLLVIVASRTRGLRLPSQPKAKDRGGVGEKEDAAEPFPWDLVAINFTTFVFLISVNGFRNSIVPMYGGNELSMSAGTLGLMLGGSAVLRFVVTVISGFASDRYGRKTILFPGVLFLVAGSLSFPLARDEFGFAMCLLLLSLGGFGNSVPTTMAVDAVPPNRVGWAISVNRCVADIGVMVGPVALGFVLDAAGFRTVTLVAAALLLSTIPAVALAVRQKRPVDRAAAVER